MKSRAVLACLVLALSACSSPPKAPEPTGDWVPVNKPPVASPVAGSTSVAVGIAPVTAPINQK